MTYIFSFDKKGAYLVLAGRIFLSLIFIASGVNKIMDWSGTFGAMETQGVPMVAVASPVTILLEVLCGLGLMLGVYARSSAFLLFLFLIPVTLVFHDFWTMTGAQAHSQQIAFMKNIAIMGGLLVAAGMGPGPFALMRKKYKQDTEGRVEIEEIPIAPK